MSSKAYFCGLNKCRHLSLFGAHDSSAGDHCALPGDNLRLERLLHQQLLERGPPLQLGLAIAVESGANECGKHSDNDENEKGND